MADITITQGELAYELEQLGYISGHHVTSPDDVAELIFSTALTRREPSYDNGCVYSDAQGEFWVYDHPRRGWYAFADSTAYAFLTPRRPLTKLVPESPEESIMEVLREP